MLNMFIRSIIVYFCVLAVVRLMGKRQIGEMQPFELAITLIIADLACIPMQEISIPLLHGIIPILTLLLLHYIICLISRKSLRARYLISGRSAVVISPKGINYKELKRLNMSFDDLIEALRGANVFCIEDIAYAIMETNGNLSVIPKSISQPATKSDLGLHPDPAALPIAIIMDGKIMSENIRMCGMSETFLHQCLDRINVQKVRDVMYMDIDNNGKVFIQPMIGSYTTFNTDFRGGGNW